jgi:CSLREA domain-containing protein
MFLVGFLLIGAAIDTRADILTVTKTADTRDLVCDADCSLRDALFVAAPGDEIQFASPLFDAPQTIALSDTFREVLINKSLTITGKGANLLTIQRPPTATANFRVININTSGQVSLSGLTITGGNTVSGAGLNLTGGAVVTITGCLITGNTAPIGAGLLISNNQTVNLINSTVSNNTANNASGDSAAGIVTHAATLNIINSTISGNVVTGGGSGNGGAIRISGGAGGVSITNSTITNNSTDGLSSTNAGGIANLFGTVTIRNSIVAGNTGTVPDVYADIDGIYISSGYNLIGKNNGAETHFPVGNPNGNHDIVGTISAPVDPRLDPLANYGGTMPTHRLQTLPVQSPAIDQGSDLGGLLTDQRGLPRPYDDPAIPNASGMSANGSDIGAFEAQVVTAAPVSIGGKIIAPSGHGLFRARVFLTEASGKTRMAETRSSGVYRFDEVSGGETLTIRVSYKGYRFAAQVMTVTRAMTNLNFVAQPHKP